MAAGHLLALAENLRAETEHKQKWVGAESEKQREVVIERKKEKKERESDSNECCMMHHAAAPWETFLTLFHTIKTTSIRRVHVASTKHIESDIFSHVLGPFSSCEMADMNLDTFDLPVLAESKAREHAGINKETFVLYWAISASVVLLIKAFRKPTDHTNLGLSLRKQTHKHTPADWG